MSKKNKSKIPKGVVVRRAAHNWKTIPVGKQSKTTLSWPYCIHCGLVLLKNERSQRAAKELCEYWEDV